MDKTILPSGWKIVKLCEIADKCTAKNRDFTHSLILTNSAQYGIIPQTEHFDKNIAADENIDGYFIVNNGEFVYNPRISTTAPCGPIRRNHLGKTGIMSPLYTVFKLKNDMINDTYIEYYLLSSAWYRYMESIANYGARHDRMNITDDHFFAMPVIFPPLSEQQAIAEILTTTDKLIAVKERFIAAKQKQKQWLMQNLLTGKIRLPGFSGEWRKIYLRDILTEKSEQKGEQVLEICSVAVREGVINQEKHLGRSYAAQDTSNYGVVSFGDIVYTKSPTGDFPLGIVKQSQIKYDVAVSPLYGIYTPTSYIIGLFLHLFFNSYINTNNYLKKIVQKGAKNTINVNNQCFLMNTVSLPIDTNEQQAIANVLTTADREIDLLKKELEQQKQIKKYLMQKLLTGKIRVKGADA